MERSECDTCVQIGTKVVHGDPFPLSGPWKPKGYCLVFSPHQTVLSILSGKSRNQEEHTSLPAWEVWLTSVAVVPEVPQSGQ